MFTKSVKTRVIMRSLRLNVFTVIWLSDLELVAQLLPHLEKLQRLNVRTTLIGRMLKDNQLKKVQRLIRR